MGKKYVVDVGKAAAQPILPQPSKSSLLLSAANEAFAAAADFSDGKLGPDTNTNGNTTDTPLGPGLPWAPEAAVGGGPWRQLTLRPP